MRIKHAFGLLLGISMALGNIAALGTGLYFILSGGLYAALGAVLVAGGLSSLTVVTLSTLEDE